MENNLFIIGYGLSGGFGGIHDYEVIEAVDENEAEDCAYQAAVEYYENYVGSNGLRTVEEIMEEDDLDEESAEEEFNEERESWIEYVSMPYNEENLKKVDGYHLHNPYAKANGE